MHAPLRAVLAAELAALRVLLPRWFAQQPLDDLLRRLTRRPWARTAGSAQELERTVLRAEFLLESGSWLPRTCLYRSLARYAVLRRMGHEASFVMGLEEVPGGSGHAWVEVGGHPFAEGADVGKFRVTFRYPATAGDERVGAA